MNLKEFVEYCQTNYPDNMYFRFNSRCHWGDYEGQYFQTNKPYKVYKIEIKKNSDLIRVGLKVERYKEGITRLAFMELGSIDDKVSQSEIDNLEYINYKSLMNKPISYGGDSFGINLKIKE